MNPELLDLDLPVGPVPELPPRPFTPEETDRWQAENRRLRTLRSNAPKRFSPVEAPFTIEEWPLGRK